MILGSFTLLGQTEMFVVNTYAELYSVNVETCNTQTLCSTQHVFYDIAMNPIDGNLYGVDQSGYLSIIDTLTCTETVIGYTVYGMLALTFSDAGVLYGMIGTSDMLFEINTGTGATTSLGSLGSGIGANGDLTFYEENLYYSGDASQGSFIFKIDLSNVSSTKVAQAYGINGYGLATLGAGCEKDIYGSSLGEVKKIDLEDPYGSQVVCNIPGVIYGMAQKKEVLPVGLDCSFKLELPNVFTPNGDNINDWFTPSKINRIESMETTILNRWGEEVYRTNDIYINWNGESQNGKQLANGVFYYIIHYTGKDEEDIEIHGFFHLIR